MAITVEKEKDWADAIERIHLSRDGKLSEELEDVYKAQLAMEILQLDHRKPEYAVEVAYRKGMNDGINRLKFYRNQLIEKFRGNGVASNKGASKNIETTI